MSLSPAQIVSLSIWEFDAMLNGCIEANTPKDDKNDRLTDEESEMLIADLMAYQGR